MVKLGDHMVTFIVTTLIFICGLSIGYYLVNLSSGTLTSTINLFEDDINDLETSLLLLNVFDNRTLACNYLATKVQEIKTTSEQIRAQVVQYENEAKIYTDEYQLLKRKYMYIRIKHWLLLAQMEKECKVNYTDVLFFYTTKTPCPDCDSMGLVLTHISDQIPSFISFPLDYDEDIPSIKTLAELYNITKIPSIVIDGQYVYSGLYDENELLSILCQNLSVKGACNLTAPGV